MSELILTQSATAVGVNAPASFLGVGGTAPYTYEVLPFGPGGTVNASNGKYVAPAEVSSNPKLTYDYIQVTDNVGAKAKAKILVGSPLLLFCEILQREMNLEPDRVYLWNQKLFQPTDDGLYIAVSVPICKPFSNVKTFIDNSGDGLLQKQSINMSAIIDIDVMSRGPAARDRKEQVLLALNSVYAEQQQEANSFFMGKIQPGSQFTNLSNVDGAAIPYRYKINIRMQYLYSLTKPAQYFDTFQVPSITTSSP